MDPGFLRRKRRDRILDKLHRGFVNVCIGVTILSGLFITYKTYQYIRYIRPLNSAQAKIDQENLLMEGKSLEETSDVESSVQ